MLISSYVLCWMPLEIFILMRTFEEDVIFSNQLDLNVSCEKLISGQRPDYMAYVDPRSDKN